MDTTKYRRFPRARLPASLQACNLSSRLLECSADLLGMSSVPVADRVEFVMTQIGERLSYGSEPMHVMLQGVIDEALADWSTDADDYEQLEALIARRITVPKKYTGPLVVRLPEHHEPIAPPPDWPKTW